MSEDNLLFLITLSIHNKTEAVPRRLNFKLSIVDTQNVNKLKLL